MASPDLKTRIEAYTGPQPFTLTEYIRQSVAKVLELIPERLLVPYVTYHSNIGSGASIVHQKVMAVTRNARQISETDASKYRDPGSIYYITSPRDMVYWINGGMIHTLPEDEDIEVIDYSSVAETDTEITCMPGQFTQAVCLDVAIEILNGQLALIANEVFELNAVLTNETDMPALVYPAAIGTLTTAWNDVASIDASFSSMSTGLISCLNSLSSIKSEIETQLASPNEDIELGMARLQQAKNLMDEYASRADIIFKQLLADSDIEKVNKMKAYEKTIEDAHNELARASHELEVFTNYGQLIVAVRKEKNDQVLASTAYIQALQARFQSFFMPFAQARQS